MNSYLWILLAALFVHSSRSSEVDSSSSNKLESTEPKIRQPRQNAFRGNYRFQVPSSYLSPDHYAREIYSHDRRGSPDGSYGYEYQTDNGIKRKEESVGYGANKVVRGYYSYVGTDGRVYTTRYIADRFGYRAYGDHLPTQPDELYDQTRFPQRYPQNSGNYYGNYDGNNPYYPNNPYVPKPHPIYPIDRIDKPLPAIQRPIYVPESSTPAYITITPRPVTASPVYSPPAYISSSNNYAHQPFVWTTAKPFISATTIRPPYY